MSETKASANVLVAVCLCVLEGLGQEESGQECVMERMVVNAQAAGEQASRLFALMCQAVAGETITL